VRGHLSRHRLQQYGLTVPSLVGDPGIFVSDIFAPAPVAHEVGLVPHYVDKEHPYVQMAAERGVHIIDSLAPLSVYARELSSCRRIISSSLHGIVIAHSFGIPAVWMELSDRVHGEGFKFFDYYSSIGMDTERVKRLSEKMRPDEAVDFCSLPAIEIDKEGLCAALKLSVPEMADPKLENASRIS
jgi:pyruvyltransferase